MITLKQVTATENEPGDGINENGKTPLENAEIKAKAYYEAFQMPVFSCDSGLYFDELQEEEQPGLHVRRINRWVELIGTDVAIESF